MTIDLNTIAQTFEALFQQAHFSSVMLGLLISLGLTQFLKYPLRLLFHYLGQDPENSMTPEIAVGLHRWCVKAVAVLSGFGGTLLTWPDGSLKVRIVWAIAVGVSSPITYIVVTKFWPWLGEKATADKIIPPKE